MIDQQETIAQPFKYVGQYGVMTEPNGLYYMWARYYDPNIGRFISEDPIGLEGGLNLYAYVGGNPTNYIDPAGEFGVVGAGIGAGLEIAIQLATNGGRFSHIDWADVAISGAVGAISPSIISSAKKLNKLSKVINRNPNNQIGRRASRRFGDEFFTQAGWQVSKAAGKAIFGDGGNSDCECGK